MKENEMAWFFAISIFVVVLLYHVGYFYYKNKGRLENSDLVGGVDLIAITIEFFKDISELIDRIKGKKK